MGNDPKVLFFVNATMNRIYLDKKKFVLYILIYVFSLMQTKILAISFLIESQKASK